MTWALKRSNTYSDNIATGGVIVDDDSGHRVGRATKLSEEECLALLATQAVGRFVFIDADGQPMALPVNYVLHDRTVAFRSDLGAKLSGATRSRVAFEIDGIDPLYHEGWSVVVKGIGKDITESMDPSSQEVRTVALEPWAAGEHSRWIVIADPTFSGRRIQNV
jgi:nitroimidazol reductase NimA-like FMN-containing flavoprotein (pyridoxamine 5'-phosphate oxidase superfamily)